MGRPVGDEHRPHPFVARIGTSFDPPDSVEHHPPVMALDEEAHLVTLSRHVTEVGVDGRRLRYADRHLPEQPENLALVARAFRAQCKWAP